MTEYRLPSMDEGGIDIPASEQTIDPFLRGTGGAYSILETINATNENLTIDAGKITISGETTFVGDYDPSSKLGSGEAASDVNNNVTTINGGKITTGTVSLNRLDFTPLSSSSATGDIIATINASSEGITIAADNIEIDGTTTFSSGYDPSDKLGDGDAANDINNNITTIDGGKITTGTLNADDITTGTISVGDTNQPASIVLNRNGSDGFLTWEGGNKIWSDGNEYMGFKSDGERFYFYTGATLYALFERNAGAGFYAGIDVSGDDVTIEDDLWVDGSIYIDENSTHSEKLWVNGSGMFEGNLKTNHIDPRSSNSYNLGSDSDYWNFAYADDFVNKSMGWYDDGVTMQDGRKVSDMEALELIQPDKKATNKNGSKKLDRSTLPIEVYRPAWDRDKDEPYPRNKDDKPYNPETGEVLTDGESLTHMVSVMLGALKEVNTEVRNLKQQVTNLEKRR